MFRFMQEPSSGSSSVLSWNYKYGFLCSSLDMQSMSWRHISLLCRRAVHSAERNWSQNMPPWHWMCIYRRAQKTIFVVLAKHRTAPWWWFLPEPKHVGASIIILNCFIISMICIIVCISWNNKSIVTFNFTVEVRANIAWNTCRTYITLLLINSLTIAPWCRNM